MLRFPNPGSTIENFVAVYRAAHDQLEGRIVGLDDIVQAIVAANLATSSGYMGAAAVERSTRPNRSLDPLYNQAKMYTELFRHLGWLRSTSEGALTFTFTLLGKQLVNAHQFLPLFEECVLGIAVPTPSLTVRGSYSLRPFALLLRVMAGSGEYLSRDEMIIGPLSADDDREMSSLSSIISSVSVVRQNKAAANAALDAVAKARSVNTNTLKNYTRWPIAALRDTGWVDKTKARRKDGSRYEVFALTDKGRQVVRRLDSAIDLRTADAATLSEEGRKALIFVSHFQMLERSGFDVSPMAAQIAHATTTLSQSLGIFEPSIRSILYSPFQSAPISDLEAVFGVELQRPRLNRVVGDIGIAEVGRPSRSHLFVEPRYVEAAKAGLEMDTAVQDELLALLYVSPNIQTAVAAFTTNHADDDKTTFYPLVTDLFQMLGFRSDLSRHGVNYQRWDACVWVHNHAIPVEIKSPTEELYLTTKAVRQSLENKVVLLSRNLLPTRREMTSLVVGYRLPNERGEMSNLIDDIFNAYQLKLGVIDLQSLAHLALERLANGKTVDADQLSQLRGFLNV